MPITISFPHGVEDQLREQLGDLGVAVKESFVIDSYVRRKFGIARVRRLLDLDTRLQAEQWLADRNVVANYDLDALETDRCTLEDLFGDA